MAQHLVVGLIVIAATLYSLWMFMPAPARRALATHLAALARRCGLGEQDTERLQATLSTRSSCGQCDGCKGCATAARRTPAVDTGKPGGSPDIARSTGQ